MGKTFKTVVTIAGSIAVYEYLRRKGIVDDITNTVKRVACEFSKDCPIKARIESKREVNEIINDNFQEPIVD